MAFEEIVRSVIGVIISWLYIGIFLLIIYKIFAIIFGLGKEGGSKLWNADPKSPKAWKSFKDRRKNKKDETSSGNEEDDKEGQDAGQDAGFLEVVVLDAAGNGVEKATVELAPHKRIGSSKYKTSSLTNKNGSTGFKVREGIYNIRAQKSGYEEVEERKIEVRRNSRVRRILHMSLKSDDEGDPDSGRGTGPSSGGDEGGPDSSGSASDRRSRFNWRNWWPGGKRSGKSKDTSRDSSDDGKSGEDAESEGSGASGENEWGRRGKGTIRITLVYPEGANHTNSRITITSNYGRKEFTGSDLQEQQQNGKLSAYYLLFNTPHDIDCKVEVKDIVLGEPSKRNREAKRKEIRTTKKHPSINLRYNFTQKRNATSSTGEGKLLGEGRSGKDRLMNLIKNGEKLELSDHEEGFGFVYKDISEKLDKTMNLLESIPNNYPNLMNDEEFRKTYDEFLQWLSTVIKAQKGNRAEVVQEYTHKDYNDRINALINIVRNRKEDTNV